nr:hypothetical protein CFP56_20377 [Quercus suber]
MSHVTPLSSPSAVLTGHSMTILPRHCLSSDENQSIKSRTSGCPKVRRNAGQAGGHGHRGGSVGGSRRVSATTATQGCGRMPNLSPIRFEVIGTTSHSSRFPGRFPRSGQSSIIMASRYRSALMTTRRLFSPGILSWPLAGPTD